MSKVWGRPISVEEGALIRALVLLSKARGYVERFNVDPRLLRDIDELLEDLEKGAA